MIFETIHNQVFIETKLAKIEIFPNYENEDFSGKIFFLCGKLLENSSRHEAKKNVSNQKF